MSEPSLSRLEARIEALVEGAFSQLFGRHHGPDISFSLTRAVDETAQSLQLRSRQQQRQITFVVSVPPDALASLFGREPTIEALLTEYVRAYAAQHDLHFEHAPDVRLRQDGQLLPGDVMVRAEFSPSHRETSALERVTPAASEPPPNAHLLFSNGRMIMLSGELITVGRSGDNHIVLDDPHLSRHHAQLRLRYGSYTLFDTGSTGGTFVNERRIREHMIRSGDSIRFGMTSAIYLDDLDPGETQGTVPLEQ
jgi:hypothetical protein